MRFLPVSFRCSEGLLVTSTMAPLLPIPTWNAQRDVPSNKGVLERNSQSMSNVQLPGDVWRRESDGKGASGQCRAILGITRLEEATLIPPVVVGSLDLDGVIPGGEVARDVCLSAARFHSILLGGGQLTLLLALGRRVDPLLDGRHLLLLLLLLFFPGGRLGVGRRDSFQGLLGELFRELCLLLGCMSADAASSS